MDMTILSVPVHQEMETRKKIHEHDEHLRPLIMKNTEAVRRKLRESKQTGNLL